MEAQLFGKRDSKQSYYDKRLILKIVKEVEAGLPRKLARDKYGLGKSSLCSWMKRYGSEHYHEHLKRRSYTHLEKRTIVRAIAQGRMSIKEAQIVYKVKTEKTIRNWLLYYKEEKIDLCQEKQTCMANKRSTLKASEAENLQQALQEAELQIKALNTMIDVAEERLKIAIRKKSGAKQY